MHTEQDVGAYSTAGVEDSTQPDQHTNSVVQVPKLETERSPW